MELSKICKHLLTDNLRGETMQKSILISYVLLIVLFSTILVPAIYETGNGNKYSDKSKDYANSKQLYFMPITSISYNSTGITYIDIYRHDKLAYSIYFSLTMIHGMALYVFRKNKKDNVQGVKV